MRNARKYLKAHIALVGSVLVWYLATYPNGAGVKYVSVAIAVLTALGVAVADNRTVDDALDHAFPNPAVRGNTDAGLTLIEALVVVVIVAIILALVFGLHR